MTGILHLHLASLVGLTDSPQRFVLHTSQCHHLPGWDSQDRSRLVVQDYPYPVKYRILQVGDYQPAPFGVLSCFLICLRASTGQRDFYCSFGRRNRPKLHIGAQISVIPSLRYLSKIVLVPPRGSPAHRGWSLPAAFDRARSVWRNQSMDRRRERPSQPYLTSLRLPPSLS